MTIEQTTATATQPLGQTAIRITPIGLGAWQFSEGQGFHGFIWNRVSESERDAIVRAALAGGINWFDTAELYGNGRSERGLSLALQRAGCKNGDVVIATKWNPLLRRAPSIRGTIDARLTNLFPFDIDLHQVHNAGSFSSPEDEMNAMADLLDAGQIRSVGVSNFNVEQMRRADVQLRVRGYALSANQVKYSLLDRKIESSGVLALAKELGATIIAYSPLEMGLLSGKFHDNPDLLKSRPIGRRLSLRRKLEESAPLIAALREIASAHDATPSQVALNWLISFHGTTVVAIPGATKVRHAEESAAAMNFTLSPTELEWIEVLSRPFL